MILKTRLKNGLTSFLYLGNEFQIIEMESSPDIFKQTVEEYFGTNLDLFEKEAVGFIVNKRGSRIEPIYKGFDYHIMHNSGELFMTLDN